MSSVIHSDCRMLAVARFAKAEELTRREVCSHSFFHTLLKRVIWSFLT
jgi:hypothetical protein